MIVGLGAAAGEDDFLGPRSDEGGDLLAGGFHRAAGTLTGSVDGSSVAKFLGEIGQDGVEHFRLDRRGGVEIEINAVHGATHRILPAGVSCLHLVGSEIAPRERSPRPARAPGKEQVSKRFLVNHNGVPPLVFFKSVDFKGTLSCFRINTYGSVDSKGSYRRVFRAFCKC